MPRRLSHKSRRQMSIFYPQGGKIHVYTGENKGKTTAALGLAMRALGHGKRVVVIQFTKGRKNMIGEYRLRGTIPNYEIYQFGRQQFIDPNRPELIDINLAREGLDFARKIVRNRCPDILILDEINIAMYFKLLPVGEVLEFLDDISIECEVVLTGQKACREIIERADLVTEMRKVKHYFDQGVQARAGIEY